MEEFSLPTSTHLYTDSEVESYRDIDINVATEKFILKTFLTYARIQETFQH